MILSQRQATLALAFSLGLLATVAQGVLLRESLAVFFGNELSLSLVLACWLMGVGLGASLAGPLAGDDRVGLRLTLVIGAMVVLLPLDLLALRLLRTILELPTGVMPTPLQLLCACLCLVTPYSALVGFSFPLACRALGARGSSASTVYVIEAIGAVVGGLALTFVAAGRLGALPTVALAALPAAASTLALARRASLATLAAALALALASWTLDKATIPARFHSLGLEHQLLASMDSPYQHLDLGLRQGQYTLLGNSQILASFPDPYASEARAHLAMIEHPRPRKVLLMGGSASGLVAPALLHGIDRLDLIELDRAIGDLTMPYLEPAARQALADPRVRLIHEDGRSFVRSTSQRYDLVIIEAAEPSTALLNRYYTLEFLREVRRALNPGGVVTMAISSSANYLRDEEVRYNALLVSTLMRVFPEGLALSPGQELRLFASNGTAVVTEDPLELGRRWRDRNISTTAFSPLHPQLFFPHGQVERVWAALRGSLGREVNTDSWPLAAFLHLLLAIRWAGGQGHAVLAALGQVRLLYLLLPLGLWGLLHVTWALLRPPRRGPGGLLLISTAGLGGMTLEVVVLLSFQATLGQVYQWVGALIALFMGGLALGGWLTHRWRLPLDVSAPALELTFATFALALPVMLGSLRSPAPFLALMAMAGMLTGWSFPVAMGLSLKRGWAPVRAAGLVDGADHLGASLGALFTGLLVVPVLGMEAACGLVAGLKALSLVYLVASTPSRP